MPLAELWAWTFCYGVCSGSTATSLHHLQMQTGASNPAFLSASPLLWLQKGCPGSVPDPQSTLVLKECSISYRIIQPKSDTLSSQGGEKIPSFPLNLQHRSTYWSLRLPPARRQLAQPQHQLFHSHRSSWHVKYCLVTVTWNDSNWFHEWK